MSITLLRRVYGSLLLFALLLLGARPAQASHLLGGEMSYRYLDATGPATAPFRYELTATFYINGLQGGGVAGPLGNLPVAIYNRTTGIRLIMIAGVNYPTVTMPQQGQVGNVNMTGPTNSGSISPSVPAGCAVVGPSQPFIINKFVGIVNLPVSFDGYYAVASPSARNYTLTNLDAPATRGQPLTLYVSMAPPLISNRSPVFSDTAVAIVCQNDTTITLNNAFDADGDRLVYSFGSPYGQQSNNGATFPPLPQPVPYFAGYSTANPFGTGTGNFATINANTGVAKYGATTNGLYVVAVDVSEYRTINGREVLIGTTRRDLQLVVSTCPPTPAPLLPPTVTTPRNYTIEEGQSLSIPITATQSSGNHPLTMTVNSALLDGSGPFITTFNGSTGTVSPGNLTGTATATGNGSVAGTFVFNSACGNARATAYDLGVTVKDNGCGGKIASDIFRITVTRAAGPNAINGPALVCDPATVRTYTAAGPTPASYRWRVTGGTITSGQNTSSVQVTWGSTNTTGTLVLKGISSRGCPTDSVVKTVDIRPLPALTVTATAPSICVGNSTTLTVAGQAGLTYSWTGGGQTSTATTLTVSPTTTTTYTVVGTDGTCTTSATITVTVTPPPVANAGPDRTVCSGVASAPLGTAAVAGLTYSWGPATGLSSTSTAQPTVTLPNLTGVPLVVRYGLTVTSGVGCVASVDSVIVTVAPAATVDAGPVRTICPNVASPPLGTPALPGYTYSWGPATGLSSTTAAQPTVTLPNTTGTPITATYTLTATTANGCTATATVVITVSPAAIATPGPAISFCSGTISAPLGGAALPGYTYSWSPTTGLSNPTSANPTVTGTTTTGAPIITTYTLTATTANGCAATATVTVTLNPAAVADAGPTKQTCSNVGVVIGGPAIAGTIYAWSPATGLSSTSVANPTLTLPNLTGTPIVRTYTLTATTANGCVATGMVDVTINPTAVAQAGADKQICSNVGVAIGSGASITGTTYAWSPATGLSSASVLNPTVTLPNLTNAPLTQQYILLATTANGCFQRDTVVVTINPAAVAVVGANTSMCSGMFTDLGSLGTVGTTYSWNPTTGLDTPNSPGTRFTANNTTGAPVIYTFTLTATTANGCVATNTVTVTVNPTAVADAGPDAAVCDLKRLTLGTPARPGYTYSWSPSTGLSNANTAQPILTASNTTATPIVRIYTVIATDGNTVNQCSSTDAVTITINPRPAPEGITGPASVCPTVTSIAYSVPTPAATVYTWLINGGTIASGQSTPAITVDWGTATAGAYLKVFRLNAQGCSSDTTTLPIVINQRLQTVRPTGPGDVVAVAPLPRAICQADGPYTYISGVFANGSSYSWAIVGGTQVSTVRNTVTVGWNPVTVPTIGKIIVTETSNPAGGICRGVSDTLFVNINPSPRPSLVIVSPVRVCQTNGPVTFSLPGGFAGSSYVFQLSGTTLAGTGNSRTLSTLPAPGTYSLTVRETSAAGCVGPLYTTPFTVSPTPVAPTISGSAFVCNTATPQPYTVANPTPGATFQWTITGGAVTAGGTSSTVTVLFNPTGPYAVSAVEISASPASCPGPAATRTITFDNPTLALANASVDATSNNRVIINLSAPNSANTPNQVRILRRVAGSGSAFASVGTVAASATAYTDNNAVDASANSYEYQLDLTNGCGTVVPTTTAQTIRLVATNATNPGTGGYDQGKTSLTWNAFVGFAVKEYQVFRRNDAGSQVLVATVPFGSPLQATIDNAATGSSSGSGFAQNFRVVAKSSDATPLYSNSNEARVDFANLTKTYNVITPNRDGYNDVLVIDNILLYPGNTFTVFNRWGREVYKTTNYQNNWGGDENTATGNYYFLLTLPNGSSSKGWFEIVK